MLEDEDIQKIIEANREVFATKEDFEGFKQEMKEDFSELQSSVDAYAKKADDYFQEMLMLSKKVDRIEKGLRKVAKEVGVDLEL